jgi:Cu+-exporting ATPase
LPAPARWGWPHRQPSWLARVAAQHGILIKDAQALELAHKAQVVVFDKTGTLTVGHARLTKFLTPPDTNEALLLALAAALQSGSSHPLARAVVASAKERGLALPAVSDIQTIPGKGISGQVSNSTYAIGNLRWMKELGAGLAPFAEQLQTFQDQDATLAAMAQHTPTGVQVVALMAFADEPKTSAAPAVAGLRSMGMKLMMLSGDNQAAAQAMAGRVGLNTDEVVSDVLPADKVAQVRALRDRGQIVIMVGDGVNDAPALAAADVGVAMANAEGGTDVAMHAAGITLMRGDLSLVMAALDISNRTVAKIRQNLFWAFVYNVAGIPLAAFGYLNPVMAGAAMALSSVSVMSNALLLKRWHPRLEIPNK